VRIAAIGDLHGEKWKLMALLKALPEVDQLVFLGDYVDRGPDVCGTLDELIRLQNERPETVFLRGNHEQLMLDARAYFDPGSTEVVDAELVANWFGWGGFETVQSYTGRGDPWFRRVPDAHWRFLEATRLEHRAGPYIFVHAGLPPPGHRDRSGREPRLWIREAFLESDADFGGIVVFGHTPVNRPFVGQSKIGIDTGAVFGGRLTAALLDPDAPAKVSFIQV
jgi:serine/threonine protein phosphatase 1